MITLNESLHNEKRYNRELDVNYNYVLLSQGPAQIEIGGDDLEILLELITRDMLMINGDDISNENIRIFKPYVKRMLVRKTSVNTVKDYVEIIKLYKSPNTRPSIEEIKDTHMFYYSFESMYRDITSLDFNDPEDLTIEELGVTSNVRNMLARRANILTLKQLKAFMKTKDLKDIRGLGKVGIQNLLDAIENIELEKRKGYECLDIRCTHCNSNLAEVGFGMYYNADINSGYEYNKESGKFELTVQEIDNDKDTNIYCSKCGKTLHEEIVEKLDELM